MDGKTLLDILSEYRTVLETNVINVIKRKRTDSEIVLKLVRIICPTDELIHYLENKEDFKNQISQIQSKNDANEMSKI